MSIMIGPKNCGDKVVEDVVVNIPLPSCISTFNLEPSMGSTKYDDKTKVIYNSCFKVNVVLSFSSDSLVIQMVCFSITKG